MDRGTSNRCSPCSKRRPHRSKMEGNIMNTTSPTNTNWVADQLSRNWWILAVRGVAAILFGVLAFVWPGLTLLTLVYLFGAYALINGVLAFVVAFRRTSGTRPSGSLIFEGLISIAASVIAFMVPGITALALVVLIATWAIVSGIFEIVAAVRLRRVISNEWLLVLAGIASILFGVLIVLWPGAGALALVWWIGAFTLIFGALLISLAFRVRRLRGAMPAASTGVA